MCQNNKDFTLNIPFFPKEQMSSVTKIVPVLVASTMKAEMGASRHYAPPPSRCSQKLAGKSHKFLLLQIKDQAVSDVYYQT